MRVTPSSDSEAGSSAGSRRSTLSSGDGGFSLTTRRPLMSVAIDSFLERFDADAMHHVDEALGVAVAPLEIAVDQPLDNVRHIGARKRRSNDLADGRRRLISSDHDLIPLLAVLIHAEDADMPDMVVAAGVDAAGDVEVQLADLVQVIEIVEALLDRLRDRDRLCVGERAEVAARTGDDIGEQPEVGRRQAEGACLAPERG